MNYCYILYSKELDRFYVGSTTLNVNQRLDDHLDVKYNNQSFTAKADDWIIYLTIELTDYSHAREMEKKIKSQKSAKYIRNLKKYPELLEKIKIETA